MSRPAVGVYRTFLRLYPRRFRDEYGADMALLFEDQLSDEPAGRVWLRSIVDLAITVPTRHLEAHMKRIPTPTLPLTVTALSLSAVAVAVVGGTDRTVLAVGLPVAVLSAVLAAILWRETRPITVAGDMTSRWWRVLAGGAALLLALIAITTVTGEVSTGWWAVTMIAFLLATILIATGIALGVARIAGSRHKSVPG